jgi:prepilin-type N-terminal cleavage/methylation domain-containing protein
MLRSSLPRRSRQQYRGFTLAEVIIALLVSSLFFLIALRATTNSLTIKANSLEANQVLQWIQRDLENVKFRASSYQITALTEDASKDDATLQVLNAEDFKAGDAFRFQGQPGSGGTSDDDVVYLVNGDPVGNQLSISPNLKADHRAQEIIVLSSNGIGVLNATVAEKADKISVQQTNTGDNPLTTDQFFTINPYLRLNGPADKGGQVADDRNIYTITQIAGSELTIEPKLTASQTAGDSIRVSKCDALDPVAGYGDALRDKLMGQNVQDDITETDLDTQPIDPIPSPGTTTTTGKPFKIKRTLTLGKTPPYNLVRVTYEVRGEQLPPNTPNPLTNSIVVDIIPDVALYCR